MHAEETVFSNNVVRFLGTASGERIRARGLKYSHIRGGARLEQGCSAVAQLENMADRITQLQDALNQVDLPLMRVSFD